MFDDHLKGLSPDAVAAWYRRLADAWPRLLSTIKDPLAGEFIRTWLDNRQVDKVYEFDAPEHLRSLPAVMDVLRFHREVFLSAQKARFTGGAQKCVGIIPRIQGLPGFQQWDMKGQLSLEYESLCDPVPNAAAIAQARLLSTPGNKADEAKADISASLRGFQLKSSCTITVSPTANPSEVKVRFTSWYASATDRYDWDNAKHLIVPNPDYQSKADDAVKPEMKSLTVFHSNAIRLETAGLAAPFMVKIRPWYVNDSTISKPTNTDGSTTINIKKRPC